jgi:hypothetical protein
MTTLPRYSTKEERLDYYITLCEELQLNGIDSKVDISQGNPKIICFGIYGTMEYVKMHKEMMKDFWLCLRKHAYYIDKFTTQIIRKFDKTI